MRIVLATANARYHHASLALRTLRANLGAFRESTRIVETTVSQAPRDFVEELLGDEPTLVGLSVYVWNVDYLTQVAAILKRVRPAVVVVLGGPEVSHPPDSPAIVEIADYVVLGEGEALLPRLVSAVAEGAPPDGKWLGPAPPVLSELALPYAEYTDHDLAARTVYVEASRGCPFRCAFCLSALDKRVRVFEISALLSAFEVLLERGAQHFKFIDRTFNLDIAFASQVLEFFSERYREGLLLHFELVPDRLPEALRRALERLPADALQFEVGVQSLDPVVTAAIDRRQDLAKLEDNLAYLAERGVHVHADLIVGLPGEGMAAFGAGLDRLHAMGVDEIQVGILKRLRGAPIARVPGLRFDPAPPYEILETDAVPFFEMQTMKRFAHVWDRVINRGDFRDTAPLLWRDGDGPFSGVLAFSRWLYSEHGAVHGIALNRLASYLWTYLGRSGVDETTVGMSLAEDYARTGRNLPARFYVEAPEGARQVRVAARRHRRRQDQHRG